MVGTRLPLRLSRYRLLLLLLFHSNICHARIIDFVNDFGGIPDDDRFAACAQNTNRLQAALDELAAAATDDSTGRQLIIPNGTFYLHHGIVASWLSDVTILLDGTLRFERLPNGDKVYSLPEETRGEREADATTSSLSLRNSRNVTVTSSHRGVIDGQGSQYWGEPIIGYLEPAIQRPILLRIENTSGLRLERIIMQDSAYHTVSLNSVRNATIQNVSIVNRRTAQDGHSMIDLSAFNTVGIDVSGNTSHVQIQDVDIWTQDDCISVRSSSKPLSHISDISVERVNASGVGFSITGDGIDSVIDRVTVRDVYLHKSVRGIVAKFLPQRVDSISTSSAALISNVMVEDMYMESPTQWPLWLGPAQTAAATASSATSSVEHPLPITDASPSKVPNPCDQQLCSLCWPTKPGSTCQAVPNTSLVNVTLSNVTIHNPHMSPGVMLADPSRRATMESVVFDHILVVELPTWTASRNSTPPLHPYAHRLNETFPGLLQPLRDKYVPNNSDRSKRDQQARDGSYDNDDAIAVDSSTISDHWYWAAMTCMAALSALLLVFSPLLWTLVVTAPPGDADMTPSGGSNVITSESQPLSSSHGNPGSSGGPDAIPSAATSTKRVRFASADDEVSLMVGDSNHDPASTSLSSLTIPLLDPQRDISASQLGVPPPSSSTDPNPTTARRVANTFRWTHGHWVLMLAMLTSVGLITWCVKYYMIHSRANSQDNLPAWDRTDRYYLCQGLTGIARGGTWPVPSCFNQRPSQWWVLLKHLHGAYLWIAVGFVAAALLVASVALAWRYCKRRDRFRPFHEWRSIE